MRGIVHLFAILAWLGAGAARADPVGAELAALERAITRGLVQLDLAASPAPAAGAATMVTARGIAPARDEAELALPALARVVALLSDRIGRLARDGAADPRRRTVLGVLREDADRARTILARAEGLPRPRLVEDLRALLADLDGAIAALWTFELDRPFEDTPSAAGPSPPLRLRGMPPATGPP